MERKSRAIGCLVDLFSMALAAVGYLFLADLAVRGVR